MLQPETYSFSRYLAAKKSVDDRSLNRHVWETLAAALAQRFSAEQPHVLEIGAGIGTMIERAITRELFPGGAQLTALEPETASMHDGLVRLRQFAEATGRDRPAGKTEVRIDIPGRPMLIDYQAVDLRRFVQSHARPGIYDLVIAHAVLDLLNVSEAIPAILSVAKESCLFYFTLNFDGATVFQPEIDPALDRQIEELYHRTMDERMTEGKPSGDRYTGRHLFGHLKSNGIQTLAAGSSDWVVAPGPGGYLHDEAYFLHFIVHFVESALENHHGLDQKRFRDWIARRHQQIEEHELVYIAHQIDILGRR